MWEKASHSRNLYRHWIWRKKEWNWFLFCFFFSSLVNYSDQCWTVTFESTADLLEHTHNQHTGRTVYAYDRISERQHENMKLIGAYRISSHGVLTVQRTQLSAYGTISGAHTNRHKFILMMLFSVLLDYYWSEIHRDRTICARFSLYRLLLCCIPRRSRIHQNCFCFLHEKRNSTIVKNIRVCYRAIFCWDSVIF